MELRSDGDDLDFGKQPPLISAEDHEDILHPLREAANRVGREVERFAEVLDGYNPQRATEQNVRQDMMVDLIEEYHNIARDTVKRLQEKHASERQKRHGLRWRKKVQGARSSRDEDEMDLEESDDNESPLPDLKTTLDDLERWEQEAQTWDLLARMVNLRMQTSGSRAMSKSGPIHQYSTEREVWEKFLETDSLALERKTVLQWLKDSADDSGEDIDVLVQDLQQSADRGDIIAHGWLHTRAALKQQKLLPVAQRAHQNASGTESLITELDPDAMTRQKRKLENQDEYFERSIWLGCYEMLRRGKSPAELRDWCTDRTEVWRAISMSGFPDEDWKEDEDDLDRGTFESSSLWRRMCFALARKGGGDDYERAVYGILSGDISSVEPVCRTWDDFLFVHYNALLRTQFDNFVQQIRPSKVVSMTLGAFDAVQFHGEPQHASKGLVNTLRSDPRTQLESVQPMKMLQGVIIADSFPNFIYQQGLALSKFANAKGVSNLIPPNKKLPENESTMNYITLDDHDSLRVLAHMLIVFMGLGLDLGGIFRETEVENVIVAYISFLRLSGKEELIPLYCSQLSGKRKYAILCRNLIDVTNHDQRVTQIELMKELGLDVQEFVGLQARFLLSDYKDTVKGYPASGKFNLFDDQHSNKYITRKVRPDFFGEDPDKVERVDMLLIRSLEWYLLVEGLWSETFAVGTMLYLRFFKHMRLTAARSLASRIPSEVIAKVKTEAILGDSLDFHDLEGGDNGDLTEVLEGTADKKRQLKQHLIAEAKSFRELENLIECLDYLETTSSMASLQNETGAEGKKQWRAQLKEAMGLTRQSIQPLLHGWLLTSQNDSYTTEFRLLREAYLPGTLLAYITILQFAGLSLTRDFLLDCMELSSIIAEEGSDLLDLFRKSGHMQELVEVLALASKALLLASSSPKNKTTRSKKLRMRGWSQELWNVRS